MTERQDTASRSTVQTSRAFILAYDGGSFDQQVTARTREVLQREIYRCERDQYPEWIDLGGEA